MSYPRTKIWLVASATVAATLITWIVTLTQPLCSDGASKTALTLFALFGQWFLLGAATGYLRRFTLGERFILATLPAVFASLVWYSQWLSPRVFHMQQWSALLAGFGGILISFGAVAFVLTLIGSLVGSLTQARTHDTSIPKA
jgi:hypothetical protein